MAHSGKTMTFATDLVPNETDTYNLGNANKQWKIHGTVQGGQNGQVLKSNGTESSWEDEYKIEILDLTGVT